MSMNSSWLVLLQFGFLLFTACNKSIDPINFPKDRPITRDNVFFYLSDSTGNMTKEFLVGEDIFFHFGIINNRDSAMSYTKGHGGPPIVSFLIFESDSLIGYSDDGYLYPSIVTGGRISPHGTLTYSVSWYSNPFHSDTLESGSYYTTVHSYIWFDDFSLSSLLDTAYFEIR